MVSAGNSGAVMAGAVLVVGRLEGVERPAIAALIPSLGGKTLLLDAGANTDCKAVHLVQFALMGEVYMRRMLGVERPRIAVLANGEEATKGTELTREAAEALSRAAGVRFSGYAEGKDILGGEVDVVVTDGFTGNVVLKAIEGCAQAMIELLRRSVGSSLAATAGMALARPALRRFKATIDWDEHGGAPLIGVDGVGIIAHGRSGPKAIRNAIRVAAEAAAVGMGPELSRAAQLGRDLCGRPAKGKAGRGAAGAEGNGGEGKGVGGRRSAEEDAPAPTDSRRH